MKRILLLFVLGLTYSQLMAQVSPPNIYLSGDTIKASKAAQGWRGAFFLFGDGSKMTSAAGFSDTTKYLEWADSAATAGWVTREKFRLDTTYKAAQLLLRVLYSDTGTTAAKIPKNWYLYNQIQDSLAEYVLRANSVLTGTTTLSTLKFATTSTGPSSYGGVAYRSTGGETIADTAFVFRGGGYLFENDAPAWLLVGDSVGRWGFGINSTDTSPIPQDKIHVRSGNIRFDADVTGADYGQIGWTHGASAFSFTDSLTVTGGLRMTGRFYVGTSAWPSTTVGRGSGRHIIGGTSEPLVILWNEASPAGDNQSDIFLGAMPGSSATRLAGGKISGGIFNASTGAGYLDFFTTNTTGTFVKFLRADSSRNVVFSGAISGTYLFSDANVGRARLTVGTVAGTGAGKLYAGDSLYIGTTLALDASRNASLGTITSGVITSTSSGDNIASITTTGTSNATGLKLTTGNGTTSGRYAYEWFYSSETVPQSWRVGMYGDKDYRIFNETASRIDLLIAQATGAATFSSTIASGAITSSGALTVNANSSTIGFTSGNGVGSLIRNAVASYTTLQVANYSDVGSPLLLQFYTGSSVTSRGYFKYDSTNATLDIYGASNGVSFESPVRVDGAITSTGKILANSTSYNQHFGLTRSGAGTDFTQSGNGTYIVPTGTTTQYFYDGYTNFMVNGKGSGGSPSASTTFEVRAGNTTSNAVEIRRSASSTSVASIDTSGNATLGTIASGAITSTGLISGVGLKTTGDGGSTAGNIRLSGNQLIFMSGTSGTHIYDSGNNRANFSVLDGGAIRIPSTGQVGLGMNESATTMFAIKGVNTRAKILELYRSASATAVATVDTNGVPDFPNALVSGVIVGDSVRVAVPGLTTATGDAVVCYRMAASAAPDTLPSFRINAAGYITLTGKHGYTVKAFVGRK